MQELCDLFCTYPYIVTPHFIVPVLAYVVETNFGLSCIGLYGGNQFWLILYWLMWCKQNLAFPVLAYVVETHFGLSCISLCGGNPFWLILYCFCLCDGVTNFGLSCIGLYGGNPFWHIRYWLLWCKTILAYPVLAYMV